MSPAKEKAALEYLHAAAWAADTLALWHAAAAAPLATTPRERRVQLERRYQLEPEVKGYRRTGKTNGAWIWDVVEKARQKYHNTP